MDTRQLALITDDESATARDWRLDDHTRQIGRKGVAAAREALRAALADHHDRDRRDGHGPPAAA
ncbi:MAG: hypothetical protein ACLFRV_01630 [Acidimicrobiales bacterium]